MALANDLLFVMETTWPIIVITLVSFVSLRLAYLFKNHSKFVLYEELLLLIFGAYILMFFQIVTCQDVINYGNNFIPFKELTRYRIGSRLFYKNIIGNILLFMPYGFFASYYLKLNKKRTAFILILIASLSIEIVQLLIDRCFDIDDIILNVVGGMIGYFIYRFLDNLASKLSKRSISLLLVFSIILIMTMVLFIVM